MRKKRVCVCVLADVKIVFDPIEFSSFFLSLLLSSVLFSLSLSSFTVCEKWSQMLFFLSLKGFVWMHIIIYHHSWLSLSSCMMLYAEFLIVFVLYLGIDTRVVYYYGTTQIWLVWTFFCVCALTLSWCLFIPKKKKNHGV